MLYDKKIPMKVKSFAVGLRVEHSQKLINQNQYGVEQVEELGATRRISLRQKLLPDGACILFACARAAMW